MTSLEAERSGLPDPTTSAPWETHPGPLQEVPGRPAYRESTAPSSSDPVELTTPSRSSLTRGTGPAHANASRYYERAAKSERAAERLPGILQRAREELRRLEALVERVRTGNVEESEVVLEIGPLAPRPHRDSQEAGLPYRSFWSSGGLEIRVGRGGATQRRAHVQALGRPTMYGCTRATPPAPTWCFAGMDPESPPARDLEEAATLAALHSKARTSGSVPVDWTLRKYVRKPRKSPPGQVAVERTQTLFVAPDDSLVEKLGERPRRE